MTYLRCMVYLHHKGKTWIEIIVTCKGGWEFVRVRFSDKKDFRMGYTCASSLKAPVEASSLLVPYLLAVQFDLRCPLRWLTLNSVTGWRTEVRWTEEASIWELRSTHGGTFYLMLLLFPSLVNKKITYVNLYLSLLKCEVSRGWTKVLNTGCDCLCLPV